MNILDTWLIALPTLSNALPPPGLDKTNCCVLSNIESFVNANPSETVPPKVEDAFPPNVDPFGPTKDPTGVVSAPAQENPP